MRIMKLEKNKKKEWIMRHKYDIILLMVALTIGLGLWADSASAAVSGVNIISPIRSSTVSTPSIYLELDGETLLDSNTTSVEIRINGMNGRTDWNQLDFDGSSWNNYIDISSLTSGIYDIQIRYKMNGNLKPIVSFSNYVNINRMGSILITVLDSKNNPVQGVFISPGNNNTDSSGRVIVGNQPMNTDINFTVTRLGYNATYFHQIFTDTQLISKTIIINKIGGDLGDFEVTGYDTMMTGRGTFIMVKDKSTDEKIDGASVVIYDSSNVKSLPGQTVNGRVFMSIQANQQPGAYVIEVSKKGYNDYSDTFTVWANPITPTVTPSPSPTPSPVPTIDRKWRPDIEQFLSNEEYLQTIAAREEKAHNETLNVQNTTIIPPQPKTTSVFPWMLLILGVFGVGLIYYNKNSILGYLQNKVTQPVGNSIREDIFRIEKETDKRETTIKCDQCDWEMRVDPELVSQTIQDIMLDNHKKELKHGGKIKSESNKEHSEKV